MTRQTGDKVMDMTSRRPSRSLVGSTLPFQIIFVLQTPVGCSMSRICKTAFGFLSFQKVGGMRDWLVYDKAKPLSYAAPRCEPGVWCLNGTCSGRSPWSGTQQSYSKRLGLSPASWSSPTTPTWLQVEHNGVSRKRNGLLCFLGNSYLWTNSF